MIPDRNIIQKNYSTLEAVAIGTSAGGIEALSYLLPSLPRNCNKAIFVVQHITPDSDSSFMRIISRRSGVKIREACNTDEIMAGTVYFAPPNYHLLIERDYTLSLNTDEKINYSRPSIDILFETAAEAFTSRLTGILLTGVNRDGSAGLKRIADLGGTTIVQSPEDADFKEMPESALRLFKPTYILSLREIALYLGR